MGQLLNLPQDQPYLLPIPILLEGELNGCDLFHSKNLRDEIMLIRQESLTWPSKFPSDCTQEVFYCTAGSARLTATGMKPIIFHAGDMVVMSKGLAATWTVLSTVTKRYMEFPPN